MLRMHLSLVIIMKEEKLHKYTSERLFVGFPTQKDIQYDKVRKIHYFLFCGFFLVYYFICSIVLFASFYENILLSIKRFLVAPLHYLRKAAADAYIVFPQVAPSASYTIVFIGDSMTDALRSQDTLFKEYLKKYYPDKFIDVLNYGFGATNILSVKDRLEKETIYQGSLYKPILKRDVDLILIESFGYNPLSQFLKKGLDVQTKTLDNIISHIRKEKPNAVIIFVATIKPSRKLYAKGVQDLTFRDRLLQVRERESYIENHIEYANKHNIPIIDIYQLSSKDGDGNLNYINQGDYIHPSSEGVAFINREIASYIIKNRFLPL